MTVTVRPLTMRDVFTLAPILASCRSEVQALAASLASGTQWETGLLGLLAVLERLPQLRAWFADLVGMTPEAFDEQPPDVLIDILRQLRERPEAGRFFSRLSEILTVSVAVELSSSESTAGQTT